jgi:hypothetical protein
MGPPCAAPEPSYCVLTRGAKLAEVESQRSKARMLAGKQTLEPGGSRVETGGTAELISKKLGIGENTVQRRCAP